MTERDTHFFSLPDVESQIVEELNERERAEDMSSGLEQHLWGELEKARNERDEALARMITAEEELKQAEAEKLQAVRILTKLDPVRGGE